jgi:hypothetical protein
VLGKCVAQQAQQQASSEEDGRECATAPANAAANGMIKRNSRVKGG